MPTCYTPTDRAYSDAILASRTHPFAVYTADAGMFERHATPLAAYYAARRYSDVHGVDVRIADAHGLTAIVTVR